MVLPLNLGEQSYDIIIERGALNKIGSYLNLDRKVLILTDSGVPTEYSKKILSACREGYIFTVEQGERSKSFDSYKEILSFMVNHAFTRTDCVVCVGGGVCGDLGGFVAASYMRGIDFYNVPTTLLSQVDSSIGGKVAIDLDGVKNIVGAFYQPKKVVIDSNTLKTLDKRQVNAGLCEAIKMAATCDKELFNLIKNSTDFDGDIDEIILKSLKIKGHVVEIDPKEKGLRKVLNFGHTIGHAVESDEKLGNLLHGECVAIGMLPMCSAKAREEIKAVLEKYSLPTSINSDTDVLISYIMRDKKAKGDSITVIYVNEIGSFEMKDIKISLMKDYINGGIL
ncbi:MAG: 3-dehydroquinate synthase [Ruminococcaceae bacterium]|nr:3-dehydroquinate synthase [Oscillospiraceae bacterium]